MLLDSNKSFSRNRDRERERFFANCDSVPRKKENKKRNIIVCALFIESRSSDITFQAIKYNRNLFNEITIKSTCDIILLIKRSTLYLIQS